MNSRFRARVWRFLREIVIIIIGVLIALAFDQVVSEARDRQRMTDIRLAMDTELASLTREIQRRLLAVGCVNRRLDELDALLESATAFSVQRNTMGSPTLRLLVRSAFAAAPPDQMVRQFGAERFSLYGEIYMWAETFQQLQWREQQNWVQLRVLEAAGPALTVDRRWQLIEASRSARDLNGRIARLGDYLGQRIRALGVRPADSEPERDSNELICTRLAVSHG